MSVSAEEKRKEGGFAETAACSVQALLIALVIRTLLFQPFNIPSGSMKAHAAGRRLSVRLAIQLRLQPLFAAVVAAAVFRPHLRLAAGARRRRRCSRLPKDDSTDYIKRVIGLPGDRIQMIDGLLHINGVPVQARARRAISSTTRTAAARPALARDAAQRRELRDARSRRTTGFSTIPQEYVVPPGHYFMMGDNRDNSADSRVLSAVGYVPFENLVGKAQIIFFSIGDGEPAWHIWSWPWSVRWGRLFTLVR